MQHTTTVVHAVQCSGETTVKKYSTVQSVPKSTSSVLTELNELRSDVASLKTLSAKIAQIRELLQPPAFAPQQYPASAQRDPERKAGQCQMPPYWQSPGIIQMRANTQYHPCMVEIRVLTRSPIERCF